MFLRKEILILAFVIVVSLIIYFLDLGAEMENKKDYVLNNEITEKNNDNQIKELFKNTEKIESNQDKNYFLDIFFKNDYDQKEAVNNEEDKNSESVNEKYLNTKTMEEILSETEEMSLKILEDFEDKQECETCNQNQGSTSLCEVMTENDPVFKVEYETCQADCSENEDLYKENILLYDYCSGCPCYCLCRCAGYCCCY